MASKRLVLRPEPLLHLHPGIETPGQELAAFIRTNGIKALNVAGSRLSGEPRIAEFVVAAFEGCQYLRSVTISP